MRFVKDVDARGVHPRLWQFLAWIELEHMEWTDGAELWVTSLRRPFKAGRATKHATARLGEDPFLPPDDFVTAADFRRWTLDDLAETGHSKEAARFCRHLQESHGGELGVVLEPEWLTNAAIASRFPGIPILDARGKVAPHIHVQLKRPIRWTALV